MNHLTKQQIKVREKSINSEELKISDDRTIDYPDSPTGRAYIGYNKTPLAKVKQGFGFQGVLLQNDNRTLVQCHICGEWFKGLGQVHLRVHKIKSKEYKEQFGLQKTTALISDQTSYTFEARAKVYFELHKAEIARRIFSKANGRGAEVGVKRRLEHSNKSNTCDDQIKHRLISYIHQYHELPKKTIKGEGSRLLSTLAKRHGTKQGMRLYGLPTKRRMGRQVELMAPNNQLYTINYRKYDKEDCYKWLVANCPILSTGKSLTTDL